MHPQRLALPAHWLELLRSRASQPPLQPRIPLLWEGSVIGSAELPVLAVLQGLPVREHAQGWQVLGDLTASLGAIAQALHRQGFVRAWRNEQLDVPGPEGQSLGTVERGATRLLGIRTQAVHLLGSSPDGGHWLQQRAFDKPDDPGLWDTLVGGMVAAHDGIEATLERETGEEAGLSLAQLQGVVRGGVVAIQRPSPNVPHGYVDERITWYRCTVPLGVEPSNRDGEVAQFRLMPPQEVSERLQRDEFTLDAALMLVALDAT